MNNEQNKTAHHEAGHVTAALLLGSTVQSVTITPNADTDRLGSALCSNGGPDSWGRLLFLAAGEVAESFAPKGEASADEQERALESEILTKQHSAWRERFRERLDANDPTIFGRLTRDEVDALTSGAVAKWNSEHSDRGQAQRIAAAAFDTTDEQFSLLWETALEAIEYLLQQTETC